jgi:hypothetical protein
MIKRVLVIVLFCCSVFVFLSPGVQAESFFEPPPKEKPDVLSYGWRGLFLGALTGLAAGYVRYDDANGAEVLKSMAYGTVAGAGVGLIAGLNDASLGYRTTGDILLRDMTLGGWFGLVVGSVWGGVDAINKADLAAFGRGASWGYIGGVLTGLGIGIYESVKGYPPRSTAPAKTYTREPSSAAYVTFYEDSGGNRYPALAFASRF